MLCCYVTGLKVIGGRRSDSSNKLGAFITKVKKGSIADTVGHLRSGKQVSCRCRRCPTVFVDQVVGVGQLNCGTDQVRPCVYSLVPSCKISVYNRCPVTGARQYHCHGPVYVIIEDVSHLFDLPLLLIFLNKNFLKFLVSNTTCMRFIKTATFYL